MGKGTRLISEGILFGATVIAGVAALGTVAECFARRSWLCELASHFRAQYACVLLLGAGLLLAGHRPLAAAAAVAFSLVNASLIMPLYIRRACPSKGTPVCAVLLNLFTLNRSVKRVVKFLLRTNADVIVLQEVTERWLSDLRDVVAEYSYCKSVILERGFGIMLLSRLPVESADVVRVTPNGLPVVMARLHCDGQLLTVVSAHPLSPVNPMRLHLRNELLAALAGFVRSLPGPVMLLGDLNTTSWTPAFRDLLATSGLRDSRVGFGIQGSWPVGASWLRITLDHCLVSPGIAVRARRRGPSVGSDHYPIVVECVVEAP